MSSKSNVTILHRMPTPDEIEELKEIFQLIDTDGSGDIDRDELGELMRMLGFNPSEDELDLMIAEVDIDQNGSIEIEEFIQVLTQQDVEVSHTPEEFQEACSNFTLERDKEDGKLQSNVLVEALKTFKDEDGEVASEEYVAEIMNALDPSKKGHVNFHYFVNMMKKC